MEFIVSRNKLLQALQHTRHAIHQKQDRLYKCFVFTFPDDPNEATMTVHASDGDIWITETIMLDKPAVEARTITVWSSDILRPVKSLDDQPLRFVVGEYQLTVHHSCGSFRIPLESSGEALEYICSGGPKPDVEARDCHCIDYEAPELRSVLSKCNYAMAQDELRPAMNGVYVNMTGEYTDYVSSDGHKLVRVRKSPKVFAGGVVEPLSLIMPSRVVRALLKILPSTGDVTMEYQEKLEKEKTCITNGHREKYTELVRKAQVRIVVDATLTISFSPVDGRYPAYWSVIPEHNPFQMTVDRKMFIKSLDRLIIFQPTNGLTRLDICEDELKLQVQDTDFGYDANENLSCKTVKTDGTALTPGIVQTIGMQGPSLSATLKTLNTENVVFCFTDRSRAIIILPQPQPDVEEITMLLMPMLCND